MQNQAEPNLQALLESGGHLIWSVDVERQLVAFNRSFSDIIRQTFGFVIKVGTLLSECFPPEEAEKWSRLYTRALESGTFKARQWVCGGRVFDLYLRPISTQGILCGVAIFAMDSSVDSDDASTDASARNSLAHLVNASTDSIHAFRLDGTVTYCNRGAESLSGYSSEEVVGNHIAVMVPPDQREAVEKLLRKVGRGEAPGPFETVISTKSGRQVDVSVAISTICDGTGQIIGGYGIARDITYLKEIERDLRESRDSLREAQVIGGLGSYELDFATGLWTSSSFLDEIFGIGAAYLRSVDGWVALIHPDDREEMISYLSNEVVGKGERFDREYRILCQTDMSTHWVHGQGRLDFDAQGRPTRMRGVIRDITANKEVEARLRASEERFRATFEQAGLGIVHISLDGHILRANRRFCELVGYAPGEIEGIGVQQLTTPRDLEASLQNLSKLLTRELDTMTWQKQYVRKDGSHRWAKLTVSVQCDNQARPLHFISVVEDIEDRKIAEQGLQDAVRALRESEAHYRTVFQTSTDGITVSRLADGKYIDANNSFFKLTGYGRAAVIGRSSLELNLWEDPRFRAEMANTLSEHGTFHGETQFVRKDGTSIWIQISATSIDIRGVPCILGMVRDITKAKAAAEGLAIAQRALEASEARYRTAFQTSLDCININRLSDGLYIDCNQAFLDLTGHRREEVIGRSSEDLKIWVNPRDRQKLVEALERTSHCRDLIAQFRKKDGNVIWAQMSASVIQIDGAGCILSISRDITNAKSAEDEIRNLAFYDPLTQLPNRRLVTERIRQSLAASSRSNRKGALLFIDMDNFKTLNDTMGHHIGDLLLQEVGRRIQSCVRDSDTVGRLGGDEFLVLLEELSENPEQAAAEAEHVAAKILGIVANPISLEGREYIGTCSIGITLSGSSGTGINELLQQADLAMYQAKTAGRDTVRFFADRLQIAVNNRALLESDLRLGIESGQFTLYYQPQIQSGRLVGAEALLRWQHPTRGLLLPGQFISLAEETRSILPLGSWVLETACKQLSEWSRDAQISGLRVAINVSQLQLNQPDFVEKVLEVLDSTGADPRNVELELTESMLVENIEEVIRKMNVLKSHGLRFSVDDFGIGYSSLTYLKRLPLDQLKIDRSFIREIAADANSRAIVRTIISLGLTMGISVLAEGVETEEQCAMLSDFGCYACQGYFFGWPVPVHEFENFCRSFMTFDRAK